MNQVFLIFNTYFSWLFSGLLNLTTTITGVFVDSELNLTPFFYALLSLTAITLGLAVLRYVLNFVIDRGSSF